MKKNFAMGAYTALVYIIVLSWLLVGCGERVDTSNYVKANNVPNNRDCDWKYLGRIGKGHRGDFDLFQFEVDGKKFIAGSEYNGGLHIIQIND